MTSQIHVSFVQAELPLIAVGLDSSWRPEYTRKFPGTCPPPPPPPPPFPLVLSSFPNIVDSFI